MNKNQINISGALPSGLTIAGMNKPARIPRRPKHNFHITQRPYEITPFMIAPVLSGETMKNALLQCRTVSTALKNRLIGHHLEHYFFYIKLRDLEDADALVQMMLDVDASALTNKAGSNSIPLYTKLGSINYVQQCLNSVVKHYFRDEGDTGIYTGSTTGLPLAQWHNYQSILESLIDNQDMETDSVSDLQPFPEYEKAYQNWEFMRAHQLTEVSFEDYLATFGIASTNEAEDRPELIRMTKNWTYPTNTLDGTGAINTQASWSIQERADKDRFFKEPGFVFGVTIARPKLYLAYQHQASVSMLNNALSWLPATMKEHVHSSLQKFAGDDPHSPIEGAETPNGGQLDNAQDYWLDVRDLFIYGDQFSNMTLDANINAVRAGAITDFHGKKYPHAGSLAGLGLGADLTYESDGVVSLNILGTQHDTT